MNSSNAVKCTIICLFTNMEFCLPDQGTEYVKGLQYGSLTALHEE
jgi:hypothetical protein